MMFVVVIVIVIVEKFVKQIPYPCPGVLDVGIYLRSFFGYVVFIFPNPKKQTNPNRHD